MRIGLAIPNPALGLKASIALAAEAEALGFDDVWSSEVADADCFSPLAAVAALTTRVRLGAALAPAFTRPPALLAMSAAGLQEISGGRFALGIGSSSPVIVGRWMGGTFERPLTRVRETTEAVRLALSGEKVAYDGRTLAMRDFRLGLGPTDVPIFLGALGPRMYALAGELADGVLMTFAAAEAVPALLGDLRAGAAAAGRDPAAIHVWCRVTVAADEDGDALRAMLRRFIAGYGTVPAYNALLARQGLREPARAMASHWTAGRRAEAVAAVSDDVLRAVTAFGRAGDVVRRLEQYRAAGVGTLVVDPVTAATDPAERLRRVRSTLRTVAGLTSPRSP